MMTSPLTRTACWPLLFLSAVLPADASALAEAGDSARSTLAFISDTQAPIIVERLFLPSDSNTEATRALLRDIRHARPARVFLLGDLTSAGFYDRDWETVDSFLDSLRTLHIAADALLGNHELMLYPAEGEKHFEARFPAASRTGYVRTVDSVAVILLNSNFDQLPRDLVREEQAWYEHALDSLDVDSSVRVIIVCCHHSPFTNSKVVGPAPEVQKRFVPPFLASRKASLFLSGHAHAFEHFRRSGKDFLVIGGGGGLLHPLDDGPGMVMGDIAPAPRPGFHYVTVKRSDAHLTVIINALQADHATLKPIACPLAGADPPPAK